MRSRENRIIIGQVYQLLTSRAKAAGRFDKADFIYHAKTNEYRYSAWRRLIWRYRSVEHEMTVNRYWSSSCKDCEMKMAAQQPISVSEKS